MCSLVPFVASALHTYVLPRKILSRIYDFISYIVASKQYTKTTFKILHIYKYIPTICDW